MSPPRAPQPIAPCHAPLRLDPGLFLPALQVGSKQALFAALVDALAERGVAHHRDALLKVLVEREALGTSAVGLGLAIPHVRSMVVGATALVFARLRHALPFAADGAPVHVVLLIVAPYGPTGSFYQPLLEAVAGAARDDAGRRQLLDVETFEGLDELTHRLLRPLPPPEALAR